MITIDSYLNDGANYQAQCVLAYVRSFSNIQSSWNKETKRHDAEIKVGRWENCREQGYCLSLRNKKHIQLNIVFYEHRNSDSISCLMWEQNTINTPNIDTIPDGVFKTKWDTTKNFNNMEIEECGDWIIDQFVKHWEKVESNG